MSDTVCNPTKLTTELQAAGLPVAGVSATGRIDYSRDLTKTEKSIAISVFEAHDPSLSTADSRLNAYFKAGITPEKMIFALWNQIIKGDTSSVDALIKQMDQIDQLIN